MLKIKMLGYGGWEGIPAPFCSCRVCNSAKRTVESKDNRTRPELYVQSEESNFLIEISPDIRTQIARFNLPIVKDFFISHWHFDHMYGLLEMAAFARLLQKPNLYCSEKTSEWLNKNFMHVSKNIRIMKPFESIKSSKMEITALPVYHMYATDNTLEERDLNNTFGYLIKEASKKFVYLSDYYKVPRETVELVKNSDVLVADGTYLFEELFPDKPEQNGEKSDPDHLHGGEIFNLVKSLGAKRTIFHSITHLSEKTHEELQDLLPNNCELAYDGMEIAL